MEPLIPGSYYHIYNRANGDENLFLSSSNYYFFLIKYQHYISPIAHTLAYCLMPNHFHFLVKIRTESEILKCMTGILAMKIKTGNYDQSLISLYISKQFAKLFSSYTQSFNKVNERMGSMFIKNFKRKCANDENYRRELVLYIHMNPVKSALASHPSEWVFSSYNDLLSDNTSFLQRSEVFDLFGSVDDIR